MSKLLTVTVPCFNSEAYLENCIESLLPGGERMEIIIINDGSTDCTGAIADAYAAKYPNIVRVVHQENGGHGEGINQGLRHAAGTYFKVVDSDDRLSTDLPAVLDRLEDCEKQGGVDLLVSNYYYVHSDGIGDRSINYANALDDSRIMGWQDTRPFLMHQMLTIHSCTFRTECMRQWPVALPKKTFYEDNLMVCMTLPHVHRIAYMNADLYLYTIGREGQSVQRDVMMKRYHHQILVTKLCFRSCHLDDIAEPRLKKYMKHELFMMFAISILFTRLNRTDETDAAIEEMWADCYDWDPKWAKHFRKGWLRFLCLPGNFGRSFSGLVYKIANKIVRFN